MRPILGGNFSCISCSWNVEKLKRQHQSSLQRQARDTKCLLLIVWWWSKKKKYGMFFDTYVLQFMTNLKKVAVKLLKRKNSKKEGKFMRHFATTYKKTTFIFILIQPWDCISLRLPGKNESKWRVKTRRILQRKCVKETKYLSSFSLLPNSVCGPSVHPFIHPSLSCENLMMMEVTHSLHRNQWSTAYIFPPSLQGGPSARGIQFVNIIITVPPQYELPILKSNFYFNVNKRLYPTRWTTL